jgi:hypothetical protein
MEGVDRRGSVAGVVVLLCTNLYMLLGTKFIICALQSDIVDSKQASTFS